MYNLIKRARPTNSILYLGPYSPSKVFAGTVLEVGVEWSRNGRVVDRDPDPRAIGWTWFAAVMMWLTGGLHAIAGMVGIFTEEFYVTIPDYIFTFRAETWGWTHMVLGVVVFAAGAGVLSGITWARIVGVVLAGASLLISFAWLPWYPIWSSIIIAINVLVIWALTVHGRGVGIARSD